jgi:hypothetical protein
MDTKGQETDAANPARAKGGRPRAGETLEIEHIRVLEAFVRRPNRARIALDLGMSASKVSAILRLPVVQAELAKLTADVLEMARQHLLTAVGHALDTLVALLDDQDPTVRFRAAKEILDRAMSLSESGGVSETEAAVDQRIAATISELEAVRG